MFIFDGVAKRIYIEPTAVSGQVVQFTPAQLWTAYVDWVATGTNSRFSPALDSIMVDLGNNQYVGPYIFLRNDLGWRGVPPAVDPVTVVINGSFYAKDPAQQVMENQPGQETDLVINRAVSTNTIAVAGGGSTYTLEQIANAVWANAKAGTKGDIYAAAML